MTHLTRSRISLDEVVAAVAAPHCGGTCVFVGTVRSGPEDPGVSAIEYSAYDEMADAEFAKILADAQGRWPTARIAVRHRLGSIPTGEASIVIAAAAPHRDEAFTACRFVIEAVKRRLPVWKKELFLDGEASWVG